MIYIVIVNKYRIWVAELCRAGGKAGCLLPLAVCTLNMWSSKQTHQGFLKLLPAPSLSFVFNQLELCVPGFSNEASLQGLPPGLVLSQTKGTHLGYCFRLASVTNKVGCHQLFYRGCPSALVAARSVSCSCNELLLLKGYLFRICFICKPLFQGTILTGGSLPLLLASLSWEVVWSDG